jgi:hypothetical protein
VALAAHDLLASVKAPYSGLDQLAVDDAGGKLVFRSSLSRAAISSSLLIVCSRPSSRQRRNISAPPRTAECPVGKSQHAPPEEVIYRSSFTTSRRSGLARPAGAVRRRHQRLDQRPLFIGQVACRARAVALIMRASSP